MKRFIIVCCIVVLSGLADANDFRTISYNVLAFRGYPNNESTAQLLAENAAAHPEITARELSKFKPSLITLQEAPAEPLVKRFADTLAMNYVWFPGGWKGSKNYPGGFPGAVVTPYPIVDSESRPSAGTPHPERLFTRHLGRAELDTPFGSLHVISVHFHAHERSVRLEEAAAVVALIRKLNQSAPVLLQGDLNHKPDAPEYKVWTSAGLIDIGAKHGIGETPTGSSTNPRQRIDYIWATPDFAKFSTAAQVLNMPPFTPEPGKSSAYALSDHMPVLAEFQKLGEEK
ncbi:MAG: endonuclease/exonuclease/phosphatase family protein [Kiritimatiellae bacterium]|nr:endonuclease/exonuclease/phosphatase family protein [Kiritimatiellia bacterium]